MAYYKYEETKKELVKLEIKANKEIISLYEEVLKIIKKFDGKKYSKRLDTALKKYNKYISVDVVYNSFDINYYIMDRMTNKTGETAYIQDSKKYIVGGCQKSSYGDGFLQEGVLNYKNIEKRALRHKEYLIESNKEMEKGLKDLLKISKEFEEVKNKINNLRNNTPYYIREYFNLKL